jgi:hypothetical protein
MTDFASRYLLRSLTEHREEPRLRCLENIFKKLGRPNTIRTGHGVPPQPQSALQPLQTPGLAAQAQETIGRVNPANPQPSSRHERTHVTLELETAKPAARNFLHSGPGSTTSSNEKR